MCDEDAWIESATRVTNTRSDNDFVNRACHTHTHINN